MNELFLSMYVIAVETGRLTLDFIPALYRDKVAEIVEGREVQGE